MTKTSKSALSQALEIVKPDITKPELFKLIEVPTCFTTVTRYWLGTYTNKPWEQRSDEERNAALETAKKLISTASRPPDRGEANRQRETATVLAEL